MKNSVKQRSSSEPFDIYIVGLGIMGVRHITREAEECLKTSKHVLYVDHGLGIPEYLGSVCKKTTNLLGEYKEGQNRLKTYRAMAAAVVDAAVKGGPVAFATYGHPTFYVYPSVLIRNAAALLGLRVHVVPGISVFDTAVIDLAFDPGLTGFQMYEATSVIIQKRQLQPDVPCLLLQVDALESAFFTRALSKPERFVRLQRHLLKFYSPGHELIALLSSTFPILNPLLQKFPLRDLPARYSRDVRSGTLYIPPIRKAAPRDKKLEKLVFDPRHLKRITRKYASL
jgi:precorrin-6B methylase 1